MNFHFKFNLGQEVFRVQENTRYDYKCCEMCQGSGKWFIVGLPGEFTSCRGCRGNAKRVFRKITEWGVDPKTLNVGMARVELTDRDTNQYASQVIKEDYMCAQTGVGSGQNYKADLLFATLLEAEEYCKANNTKIEWVVLDEARRG